LILAAILFDETGFFFGKGVLLIRRAIRVFEQEVTAPFQDSKPMVETAGVPRIALQFLYY